MVYPLACIPTPRRPRAAGPAAGGQIVLPRAARPLDVLCVCRCPGSPRRHRRPAPPAQVAGCPAASGRGRQRTCPSRPQPSSVPSKTRQPAAAEGRLPPAPAA
eukprot:3116903-Pyramimonas_sp.AAC.1